MSNVNFIQDQDADAALQSLSERERLQSQRVPGVRTVLVVLSAAAMVYDMEAMRQKILLVYPDAAVFFRSTSGRPMGVPSPQYVDLLIDLTGPRQRQPFGYSRKLRRIARFAVGRNAGFSRKRIYDRIYDEKASGVWKSPDIQGRERIAQREVFALAGIPLMPAGSPTLDRAKEIALELPPLAQG